ncbi:transposase [Streptomyces lunalinharesii]|uniref:Transposase IS4-like domain-containing protein n=1 Tax=Streptomyces lunalinharesii TaxID=333384 RepID=A0ABN3SDC8_9ACTN
MRQTATNRTSSDYAEVLGGRWVVERTNSWMNNFGKLRRCTERRKAAVEFFLTLASAIIIVRCLIRRAWSVYRWDTRPRSPRIR